MSWKISALYTKLLSHAHFFLSLSHTHTHETGPPALSYELCSSANVMTYSFIWSSENLHKLLGKSSWYFKALKRHFGGSCTEVYQWSADKHKQGRDANTRPAWQGQAKGLSSCYTRCPDKGSSTGQKYHGIYVPQVYLLILGSALPKPEVIEWFVWAHMCDSSFYTTKV